MALHDSSPDLRRSDTALQRGALVGGPTLLVADDQVSGLHWGEWRTGRIEAPAPATDHAHINVVLGGSGRFFRCDALGPREDAYRPGLINLTLPDAGGGTIACEPVALGALGMPLDKLRAITTEYLDGRDCDFERLAHRLLDSATIRAVLLQLSQAARRGWLDSQALDHSAGVIGLSLALALQDSGSRVDRLEEDRGGLTARQMRRIEAHVAEHLPQTLAVEELAGIVELGARHFTRLFKNSFGVPPYTFVMEQRLQRARQLLGAGNGSPVTEVAMACGFSSASAFSAAYRRRFGVVPSVERHRTAR